MSGCETVECPVSHLRNCGVSGYVTQSQTETDHGFGVLGHHPIPQGITLNIYQINQDTVVPNDSASPKLQGGRRTATLQQ